MYTYPGAGAHLYRYGKGSKGEDHYFTITDRLHGPCQSDRETISGGAKTGWHLFGGGVVLKGIQKKRFRGSYLYVDGWTAVIVQNGLLLVFLGGLPERVSEFGIVLNYLIHAMCLNAIFSSHIKVIIPT